MSDDTKYISAEFARQLTSEGMKKKCDTCLASVLEVIYNKIYKHASEGNTGVFFLFHSGNVNSEAMALIRNSGSGFLGLIMKHLSGLGYTVNLRHYDEDDSYELQISWD